jgi:hypothetical protein
MKMRLKKLLAEGKLRKHRTSSKEMKELLAVVKRDLMMQAKSTYPSIGVLPPLIMQRFSLLQSHCMLQGIGPLAMVIIGRHSTSCQKLWGQRFRIVRTI